MSEPTRERELFNPEDPEELRITWEQLFRETEKVLGSAEAHRLLDRHQTFEVTKVKCAVCHGLFQPSRKSGEYCSRSCQQKAYRKRRQA